MADDKIIRCWGENIKRNGIETKKFLSYVIHKDEFSYIEKYLDKIVELNKFEYSEVILNQESNEIIFDFYSDDDSEKIIRSVGHKSLFYNIIANIAV